MNHIIILKRYSNNRNHTYSVVLAIGLKLDSNEIVKMYPLTIYLTSFSQHVILRYRSHRSEPDDSNRCQTTHLCL